MQAVIAEQLQRGDVLVLPFNKTATIANDPRVGRKFVSLLTEHGPSRIGRYEEVPIENRVPEGPPWCQICGAREETYHDEEDCPHLERYEQSNLTDEEQALYDEAVRCGAAHNDAMEAALTHGYTK